MTLTGTAKIHTDEPDHNTSLVRALVREQFPARETVAGRCWSEMPIVPVVSQGSSNALYRLGDDWVVRLPRVGYAVTALRKECAILPELRSNLSWSIPELVVDGEPCESYPWPWAIYRWLPGRVLAEVDAVDEIRLAEDLASFLRELRSLTVMMAPGRSAPEASRGVPLESRDEPTREAIEALRGQLDAGRTIDLWERCLIPSTWDGQPTWIHGDLMPGNLLFEEGRLSAIIDFGGAGVGDPTSDLIAAWTVLSSAGRLAFRETLSVDEATWIRGRGWALSVALIIIPYYQSTHPELAAVAWRMIREVGRDVGEDLLS